MKEFNLYSPRGTRVVFAHPDCGYDGDKRTAAKHLTEGGIYTVAHTEVHGFHTNVWLEEVPGVIFNSVHFEEYEKEND